VSGLDEQADCELYCRCWNQTVSESCRGVCPEWDGFSDQNNLTCHDCGRKITDTESCWGACPECADKPGYWTKVHDA